MSLPSGYKRLEYIQSSGTQYVDTGFKPNQNTKFVVDVKITNRYCHVFGARTRWQNKAFCLYWATNNDFCIQMANSNFNGGSFDETARHKITMTASELYVDDTLNKTYSVGTFQCEQNAWLMSCYSSSAAEYAQGNLYSAQIYDNESLVRDYIPCQNTAGEIGLWDDVNSVFYGNSGTGVFTAGPVLAIAVDASEITKLEYIESSGTQYIDTGLTCARGFRTITDIEFTTLDTNFKTIVGAHNTGSPYARNLIGTQSGYFFAGVDAPYQLSKAVSASIRYSVEFSSVYPNVYCKVNEEQVWSSTISSPMLSSLNILILADQYNIANSNALPCAKLYSCKIYNSDGTLVRDYIAAKLSDGTVGLYDKLHGLLYINVGTGTFTAGPVVTSPSIFVNIDGIWKPINHIYVNINNIWQKST